MPNYKALTDVELVDLLKCSDGPAFAEIYHRYKIALHKHAWNKIRNREEVQDTIQEVFAMLWTKRETIGAGRNLSGFLYTCVHNHIINLVVHKIVQSKYISSVQLIIGEESIITDHRLRENQMKELIEKEIAALPPKTREVFELSRNNHFSHKQIAEQMRTSEQTVKKQVTNALKILRVKLV